MTYWEDDYGNQYHWDTVKKGDGFYHGYIYNVRSNRTTLRIKRRRKNKVKELLSRKYYKSNERYRQATAIHQKKMEARKRQLLNEGKKFSPKQLKYKKLSDQIKRSKLSIKKYERKIKLSNTWIKKHQKIIKQNMRKMERIKNEI